MSNPLNETTNTVFSHLPKGFARIAAIVIVVIIIAGGILYLINEYSSKKRKADCEQTTLKGILLNRNNDQKLGNVVVQLENSSTNLESITTPDGTFFLDGAVLPESRIITLLVTFPNQKTIRIKDIDLTNTRKYPVLKNCIIDLQTIYITPTTGKVESPPIQNSIPKKDNPKNNNVTVPESQNPATSNQSGPPKISVLPFEFISDDNKYNAMGKGIAEAVTSALTHLQNYIIIEGAQRERVLKEIDFQQGQYVDINHAVHFGKMLGAQQVVIGNCQIIGDQVTFSARVVNVESGTIERNSATSIKGATANILELQTEFAEAVFKKLNQK